MYDTKVNTNKVKMVDEDFKKKTVARDLSNL